MGYGWDRTADFQINLTFISRPDTSSNSTKNENQGKVTPFNLPLVYRPNRNVIVDQQAKHGMMSWTKSPQLKARSLPCSSVISRKVWTTQKISVKSLLSGIEISLLSQLHSFTLALPGCLFTNTVVIIVTNSCFSFTVSFTRTYWYRYNTHCHITVSKFRMLIAH
jgi:hypothetical protein